MLSFIAFCLFWAVAGIGTLLAIAASNLIPTGQDGEKMPPGLIVLAWPVALTIFLVVRANHLLQYLVSISSELHRLRVHIYFEPVKVVAAEEEAATTTKKNRSKE